MDLSKSVAVVVASCDRYSDLWDPFFYLLWKYWPDSDLETYLVTNYGTFESSRVTSLPVGRDVTWSANLRGALELVAEPYILLLLEDLLLFRPIDSEQVADALRWLVRTEGHCLKLNPVPPPDRSWDETAGLASPGVPYRVSTVATVWRRRTLIELLDPNENAWEFEIEGSARSAEYPGFYACHRPHFQVTNAVVCGKWRRSALRAALSAGAPVGTADRPVMNTLESAAYGLALLRYRILQSMPPRLRSPMRALWRDS